MAKTPKTVSKNELDGDVALARPTNELDQLTFDTPLMQMMQQQLGPFIVHRQDCDGEPCTCGLVAAVQSLKQREMMIKRYGITE